MCEINISQEFSDTPGGRLKAEGKFSGEEFRDRILKPKYDECVTKHSILVINFDGCFGFATSFLEEAFGGLVRKYKYDNVLKNIKIISNDDETIEEFIEKFVNQAEKNV